MIWIVGSSDSYLDVIVSQLQSSEVPHLILTEDHCVKKLELFFDEDSKARREKLYIIANESSFKLLRRLDELSDLAFSPPGESLAVVLLSQPSAWARTLSGQHGDLQTAYGYRKLPVKQFPLLSLQNSLMDCSSRGKFRLHMVLLGLLYGGQGFHFYDLYRSIWFEEFEIDKSANMLNMNVPMIHYKRFQEFFLNLLLPTEESTQIPVIIPAFDWQSQSLCEIMKAINSSINPKPLSGPETASDPPPAEQPEADSLPSSPPESPTYNLLKSFQIYDISSIGHILGPESSYTMLSTLTTTWDEFLSANGLQPIYLYLAGPTKTGKSECVKALCKRFQLSCADLLAIIVMVLQWSEENISFLATQYNLDPEALQQFQKELNSTIEAKLNEGKKGKDKNAAPAEGKVDVALVTDAIVTALLVELKKKAIGVWFATDSVCQRRGCVWDVWEKGYFNEFQELYESFHAFDKMKEVTAAEGEGSSSENKEEPIVEKKKTLIDVVIEMQCDDKWLLAKYNDSLTAQQVKPKEAQGLVKAFEGSLASYFSALVSDEVIEGQTELPPLSTHSKVKTFLQECNQVLHIRPVLSSALGQVITNDEIVALVQESLETSRGRAIGWVSPLPPKSTAEETPAEEKVEEKIEEALSCEIKSSKPNVAAIEQTGAGGGGCLDLSTLDAKSKERLAAKADVVSSFLSNTVLPVLSQAVIEVMRSQPDDPIMHVADFLAQVSEKNQKEALEQARTRFYKLLNSIQ